MTAWRERPRVAAAPAAGLTAVILVAMLVVAALAGSGDRPPSGPPRTQR
jgi:hypothetical protein